MPRKQKTIHYIYKTTCIVTGRYYIGMHSTNNLEDGYMGSGKRLRYSIRKYGNENHIKEVLEYLPNREMLIEREKEIVSSDLIQDVNCMNLKEGGTGGFISIEQQKYRSSCGGKAVAEKYKTDLEYKQKRDILTGNTFKEYHKRGTHNYKTFLNRKHSDETKRKMSESSKGIGLKEKNSQYGTMWITNGVESKKIKNITEIPLGWYKGRK